MPIIKLGPLDSEGLRLDRPPNERKWSELTNVAFRDGSIVPRPGFKDYLDYTIQLNSANVEPAPANGLVEIVNPGSDVDGRSGFEWDNEIIRPDGSASLIAGWTPATTIHGDTDEVIPDGITVDTSTEGASFYVTFGNPSTSFNDIAGVMFKVRMRANNNGAGDMEGTIQLAFRDFGTGTLTDLGDPIVVRAFDVDETSYFYEYTRFLSSNPSNNNALFTNTSIDNLQLAVTFVSGQQESYTRLVANALNTTTGWTDAVDGGAASVNDIKLDVDQNPTEPVPSNWAADSLITGNRLVATAADSELEVAFQSLDSASNFSSISQVDVLFRVTSPPYKGVRYELIHNNGSTETVVDSGVTTADCQPYSQPITVSLTEDPSDSTAWTKAKVDIAAFKFKILEGSADGVIVEYALLDVRGIQSGATIEVDTISAEVMGFGSAGTGSHKLALSNRSFLRYASNKVSFTNVTNSVASESLPSMVPYDWAILYGQVYVVNGVDPTKRYPNSSTLFESLTTNNADGLTAITGRTVEAFANRILYGWVRDDTTVTPEKVAYSKINDGGTHNDSSAGDFDIIDTMGGVVGLRTLTEDLCFVGKEVGIYSLRRTGNDIAPIIVDPIDYETRCISRASIQRVVLDSKVVVLFLGWNATTGYSIFAYDGTSVQAVGQSISRALNERTNERFLSEAVGAVDSITSSYILFISEGRDIERDAAYAMSLRTGSWSRWEMPYAVFSAGIYNIIHPRSKQGGQSGIDLPGAPTLVLGLTNNAAHQAHTLPYDQLTPPQNSSGEVALLGAASSNSQGTQPAQRSNFTSTIETGDIQIVDPAQGEIQLNSARLHLTYTDWGPVRVTVSSSVDGGKTFTSEDEFFLGEERVENTLPPPRRHRFIDLSNLVHDRFVRFRIQVEPTDAALDIPHYWQIDNMFIEYTQGATNGP